MKEKVAEGSTLMKAKSSPNISVDAGIGSELNPIIMELNEIWAPNLFYHHIRLLAGRTCVLFLCESILIN